MTRIIGNQGFSLYIHIPYCKRRCPYCHFYTVPDDESSKDQLLDAILGELHLRTPSIKTLNKPLESLYFGGGTPSLFGPDRIEKIIAQAKTFASQPIEVTLEGNPEHLSYELLQEYFHTGINRLSIGAQTFDNALLKKLGRAHSSKELISSIENAHSAGFKNISIDLMYEIPNQTYDSWKESLEIANQLPIQHLSIYNLTIEPGTSFYKRQEKLLKQIPGEDTCSQMWELLNTYLEGKGWDHYEISAFTRENKYSHHNIGYWLSRPFYGLGPSAFSYWDGARFQNTKSLENYISDIASGSLKSAFYEKLPHDQSTAERIAVALRTSMGVCLTDFQISDKLSNSIDALLKQELAILDQKGILRLTEQGRRYYDTVGQIIVESYLTS